GPGFLRRDGPRDPRLGVVCQSDHHPPDAPPPPKLPPPPLKPPPPPPPHDDPPLLLLWRRASAAAQIRIGATPEPLRRRPRPATAPIRPANIRKNSRPIMISGPAGTSAVGLAAAAARASASTGSSRNWASRAATPCSMPRSKCPSRNAGRISL